MNVAAVLSLLDDAEADLATGFRTVGDGHDGEPDVHRTCHTLARECDSHRAALGPARERYGQEPEGLEPDRLGTRVLAEPRSGPIGLLRDLQDLYTQAAFAELTWTLLRQAAAALRDRELLVTAERCAQQTAAQQAWVRTRLKQAAPQAIVVAR